MLSLANWASLVFGGSCYIVNVSSVDGRREARFGLSEVSVFDFGNKRTIERKGLNYFDDFGQKV